MPWDETARILDPKVPLGHRFGQITDLGDNGKDTTEQQNRDHQCRVDEQCDTAADRGGAEDAADQPGPCLVGAEARRQSWSAKAAPGGVGAYIRRPYDREKPQ